MSEFITIARPYAKAAFDFAVERERTDNNSMEHWQQMLTLSAQVSSDSQMMAILTSDMKPEALAKLFISVCGDALDEYGQNFIKIMAENKRLSLLSDVQALFIQYCAERNAIADVDVVSATELTPEQRDKITTAVEKRLSRKVKLNCKIDKSIISGFIIRAGDMVIDSSIKGRLERLTDVLQS
ncbi:F0F1 ATP synthase subunit delta [Zophobihabitans entericus]|uniref:ATP synthase subunit delta n=1 Tax=Zophobihabitans entericus TaxID=1635327 RepID=A0A6G9IAG7_9GAMM|nr:F0F1 ATP synthase subunit delta [Zophobihabitans entericus]QIQ20714.1 F0F1 ATP synthase subunit delta [Zophobihabitans entericus]